MSKSCGFSPDITVFLLNDRGFFSNDVIPSTTTLYTWIDKGFLQTKNIDLLYKTSLKNKKQKVRKNKKILGDSIEKRPDIVDSREEFGHWEIDTVIGCKSDEEPVLLTITERKTRFELILPIEDKTSKAVADSLEQFKRRLGK